MKNALTDFAQSWRALRQLLEEQAPMNDFDNEVIFLLWQLLWQHSTAHNKFSSSSDKDATIMFLDICIVLLRRS